ncbi:MAG: tetratricopeptide repeat protein [Lachnospiraceae bacterium]|nr:tetratricopeptide repeat protein [Lachnospiraceae bacterium]
MKCYKCGSFLYESDYCSACGADVSTYKVIVKKSNEFYNKGLGYARDRNLSRAIECLETSLKMFKGNIAARNLLGLIYYEMGEYAMALAQWVVSKSMQNDNNMADYFLGTVQDNKPDLDLMSLTIRKYNKALTYIEQNNYDLAEIQLKKLLNENPHLVKGHQLLALLQIRKQKYAEARVALRKAERIDRGNPTTISYMTFVSEEIKDEEKDLSPSELRAKRTAEKSATDERAPLSGDDVIIPKSSYREYNPTTMAVIQIIIGVLIGAAIIFFIVTPAKTKALRNESAKAQAEYQAQIEELQNQISELADDDSVMAERDNYKNLVNAYAAYIEEDYTGAAEYLMKIKKPEAVGTGFAAMYEEFGTAALRQAGEALSDEGFALYSDNRFADSIKVFEKCLEYDPNNEYAPYYLGMCYYFTNDAANALKYLRQYVDNFPGASHVDEAYEIIDAIE